MSRCDGWRVWQHNCNPHIRMLVPETVSRETVNEHDEIPIRTPIHPSLGIYEVVYNQTVDAGKFPAKGLLEHYHLVSIVTIRTPPHGQYFSNTETGTETGKTKMYSRKDGWIELGECNE